VENAERFIGRRWVVRPFAVGVAVVLAAVLGPAVNASAAPPPACSGTPMLVTGDCVDPVYNHPVIDSETDLTSPVPNHKVSGHFDGTTKRFTIYLPPKSQWQGRFFQSVYPLQNEIAKDDPAFQPPGIGTEGSIAFGAASGAYTVQTNGGSGYRVDAAAAKFSKTVAAGYYGTSQRIYGYEYGGSGGSFQAISGIENTTGVWDGAVPFVIGTPVAIPNFFFVRAFARFVLLDKAPQIADAVSPGGSGDPYAGLNDAQRTALHEVTKLGVPLRAWENYSYVLGLNDPTGLLGFAGVVEAIDPTYVNDFWTKPGYLGTEQSPLGDLFRAARAAHVDTDWNLALLTYHRHQVPALSEGLYAFDQFRNPDGTPIYPQRPVQIGPLISASVTGGGTFTGAINGKVIVVDNLLDTDAFAWPGDWYAQRVKAALGASFDDSFRVWFNDNADHIGPHFPNLVQYDGIVQQALRDVSAWAELGVGPPRSTRYEVKDSQVSVPDNAAARRGIQPVVDLSVKNGTSIDVAAGQDITFKGKIKVPPGTGEIVALDWDFAGNGSFTPFAFGAPKPTVEVHATFTYTTPGTYFAALQATSERDGDTTTPFAQVQNLGTVRVVVH
jgi:hypothetical protein